MVNIWLLASRNAIGYWIFGHTGKSKTQIGISQELYKGSNNCQILKCFVGRQLYFRLNQRSLGVVLSLCHSISRSYTGHSSEEFRANMAFRLLTIYRNSLGSKFIRVRSALIQWTLLVITLFTV